MRKFVRFGVVMGLKLENAGERYPLDWFQDSRGLRITIVYAKKPQPPRKRHTRFVDYGGKQYKYAYMKIQLYSRYALEGTKFQDLDRQIDCEPNIKSIGLSLIVERSW